MNVGLSDRDRRTLIVGVVTVGALGGIARGIPAARAWNAEQVADAQTSAEQVESVRVGITSRLVVRDRLIARRARLTAVDSVMLSGDSPSAVTAILASLLEDIADDNSLKVGTLQLRGDTVATDGLLRAAVRLTGITDVTGLSGFLRDVEGGSTPLVVRDLTVSQPEPAGPDSKAEALRVDLLIEGIGIVRREAKP
jgi:hypothetical protein